MPNFNFLISAEEVLAALLTRAEVTLTITFESSVTAAGNGVAVGLGVAVVLALKFDLLFAAAAGFFGVGGAFFAGVGSASISKFFLALIEAAWKAKKHVPNKASKPKYLAHENVKLLVGFDMIFLR